MTPNTGRKRRRIGADGVNQEWTNLPSIPGIPLSVLPYYVQAMKDVTAFLRKSPSVAVRLYREHDGSATAAIHQSRSVVNNEIRASAEEQESMALQHKAETALSQWLGSVRSCIRENCQKDGDVVVHTMGHLHELSKRAVTHLMGRLLWKSAEARRLWVDNLLVWTDLMVGKKPVWQREAYWLIVEFHEKYRDLYPTVSAAMRRMEQLCPSVLETSTMVDEGEFSLRELRRVRDQAMSEIHSVAAKIQVRIKKAHEYLDILAPHLLQSIDATNDDVKQDDVAPASNCSDNESDIDWEEGDSDFHSLAVERTLETMRVTGGLNEGSIEINFESSQTMHTDLERMDHNKAREGMEKEMAVIVVKAMPLLSRWIQALMQADSLISSEFSVNALVKMTGPQCATRKNVLERVMELKRSLTRLVASAQRLGVQSAQSRIAPAASQMRESTVQLGTQTTRNQTLHEKLSRPKKLQKNYRPNRIQIKYRKYL